MCWLQAQMGSANERPIVPHSKLKFPAAPRPWLSSWQSRAQSRAPTIFLKLLCANVPIINTPKLVRCVHCMLVKLPNYYILAALL